MNCIRTNKTVRRFLSIALCCLAGSVYAQDGEGPVEEGAVESSAVEVAPDPYVDRINAQLRGQAAPDEGGTGALLGSRTSPLINLGRWVVAVCVVLALILILAYAARRFASHSPLLAGADLGHVIGRIYLNRQAALYYVETGGRILVIGVTNNNVSLVSEFDAETFDGEEEHGGPSDAESFLSQLEQSANAMRVERPQQREVAATGDKDLNSMKVELERMRRMLADD